MASRRASTLIRAARKGDVDSQIALAKCYLHGTEGLPQGFEMALMWLDRARVQGSRYASMLIGESIPWAVLQTYPDGAESVQVAARMGSAQAQRTLAHLMLAGTLPERVLGVTAREWLERALVGGLEKACADLDFLNKGELHLRSLSQDSLKNFSNRGSDSAKLEVALCELRLGPSESARMVLIRLADSGNPDAMAALAMQEMAEGRLDLAVKWWRDLALNGDAEAMLKLADCYMQSQGVRISGIGRSHKSAAAWLVKASNRGSKVADYSLYLLYRDPRFSMRNAEDSKRHLQLAAEKGHPVAQYELASRLLRGACSRVMRTDVAIWFKRAVDQGHEPSCRMLQTLVARQPEKACLGQELRKALALVGQKNIALATRLELGWVFGLRPIESVWVDLERGDRDLLLECDLSGLGCRKWPTLILIESAGQREVLARARRYPPSALPRAVTAASRQSEAEKVLKKFVEQCGVDLSVFVRSPEFSDGAVMATQ